MTLSVTGRWRHTYPPCFAVFILSLPFLVETAFAQSAATLVSTHRDVEAVAVLSRSDVELQDQEKFLLVGASARAEAWFRVLAVEQARSLVDLCECRQERGTEHDPELLSTVNEYAEGLLGIRADDPTIGVPGNWDSASSTREQLAGIFALTLGALGEGGVSRYESLGLPVDSPILHQLREAVASGLSSDARQSALAGLLAFGTVDESGSLVSAADWAPTGEAPVERVITACGRGHWLEAARLISEFNFAEIGTFADTHAPGLAYVDPALLLACSRVYGRITRTVGKEVAGIELPNLAAVRLADWLARSAFYSGRPTGDLGFDALQGTWKAQLYDTAANGDPLMTRQLSAPADSIESLEFEAERGRIQLILGAPRSESEMAFERAAKGLERMVAPTTDDPDHVVRVDKARLPELRLAFLATLRLGLDLGHDRASFNLARLGLMDVNPGSCGSGIEPTHIMFLSRASWRYSRNNWQQVLRLGQCLVLDAEIRQALSVDVVNRWTASVCAPVELDGQW